MVTINNLMAVYPLKRFRYSVRFNGYTRSFSEWRYLTDIRVQHYCVHGNIVLVYIEV